MSVKIILEGGRKIPFWLFELIASWAISLTAFTCLGLGVWALIGQPDHNLLDSLPRFFTYLFGIWGVYTAIGAILLWFFAWIYLFSVDHAPFRLKAMWTILLIFAMYYGALFYFVSLWLKGKFKCRDLSKGG